ncbi:hypothetical protein GCM10027048_45350 [Hymenobacter coalescens]
MLFGASAYAQGPWTQLSVGSAVPLGYITEKIVAVNANTVWVLYREIPAPTATTAPPARTYARTTDGGATWTGGTINIPADLNVANITAIDGNTAWLAAFATVSTAIPQQGIYKTTDGGVTWVPQGSSTFFKGPASFPNGVHFWDANNGVAFGDANPHTVGSRLEVYTTNNGGTTWTLSNSAPQVQNLLEYGLAGSFFVLGNTIWHGGVSDDGDTNPGGGIGARLYRSTDRGLTWTSHPTDLVDAVNYIAFTDQQNGLISSGYEVCSTSNGGQSNALTATVGTFRSAGMDAIPGLANAYISVGVPEGGTSSNNGSSISFDGGQTWSNMLPGTTSFNQYEIDMLSPTVGYTGAVTQATQAAPTVNVRGVTKLTGSVTASRTSAAMKGVLQVFPNPSNDGQFNLKVNASSSKSREVTVTDALGRVVYHTNLNAASAGQGMSLDLSKHKAGVYTLRLETEQGTAIEKLVIQ